MPCGVAGTTPIEWGTEEGASPVRVLRQGVRRASNESSCLRVQLKVGGKFHLKLNISKRPIANKYREGKMKRTLKRECKGLEIAKREAAAGSSGRAGSARPVSASVSAAGTRSQGGSSASFAGVRIFNLGPVPRR